MKPLNCDGRRCTATTRVQAMLHRLPSALEYLPDTSRRGQRCRVRAVRDLWVAWHACLRRRSPFGPFGGWARDGSRACRPCAPLPPLSHAIVCHGIVRRPDALVSTCTPDAASGLTSPRLLRDAQKPARAAPSRSRPQPLHHLTCPPRMLPVASKYTQRPRGAVGRWWWPSLAHASRVSLGGRHGRPRACVAVSMQAARDAQSRMTLETDAAYVSCPSPSGPGSICPSEASSSSTSHTRTARPESVDFGSWRRGAVAFSSEACRPTQPQWRLSAVPIGLGRRVRRLSSRLVGVFSFSDVSRRCDCRNGPKCAAGGTPHLRSGAAHTTARGIWGCANSLRRAR